MLGGTNIDDVIPFSIDDLDTQKPIDFATEKWVDFDQWLVRHKNDVLLGTNELGGLNMHQSAAIVGTAILTNNSVGVITSYILPRVRISNLFGVHSSHKIIEIFNHGDIEYLFVDIRGLQLITSKPKSEAHLN